MNDREMLLRRLSAAQFAAWELKMYLDTHPNDQKARVSAQKYQERTDALAAEYESKYGPVTNTDPFSGSRWKWVDDPWPWDIDFTEGDK